MGSTLKLNDYQFYKIYKTLHQRVFKKNSRFLFENYNLGFWFFLLHATFHYSSRGELFILHVTFFSLVFQCPFPLPLILCFSNFPFSRQCVCFIFVVVVVVSKKWNIVEVFVASPS
jgi:hypothetical protein